MTHSRSRSGSNTSGLSEVNLSMGKKAGLAILQVFQNRKADEYDVSYSRARSNTGLVDYLKGKKQRNNSAKSGDYRLDGDFDLPEYKLPKTKSGYHTWSWRRNPPPPLSATSNTSENSPKTPRKFGYINTLGRSKKGRRAALSSSTFKQPEDVVEATSCSTPPSLSGLFPNDGEYIEIRCDSGSSNRNSVTSGNGDSGDYDELSTGSEFGEDRSHELSRHPSNASRNSTPAMPPSPVRPPKTPKAWSSPGFIQRINATLSPRQRRRARAALAADSDLLCASSEEEPAATRSVDDCDLGREAEDVFVTWDGRNAMTLPRPRKKAGDSLDTTTNLKEVADGKKNFKRPSIIRPQSMMINRPAQYPSVANPAYPSGPQSRNSSTRPVSTLGKLPVVPNDQYSSNNRSNRSSYYDEDDDDRAPPLFQITSRDPTTGSIESLDEATADTTELENDPDLMLKPDEPEAWSVTADKKVLKKMSKKDIKRQDNIYEFIQTERNYLTTLKIMQKIYARGMADELHYDQSQIERFFPCIDEHVDFVAQFVHKLNDRQADKKVVERIGDVLVAQWGNGSGSVMKRLLGEFSCRHNSISHLYKENLKNDKKFQAFIKKCEKNPLVRRQGIPECALLVTQRTTKYPLMVQALIENSKEKDHKEDFEDLNRALELSKEIAKDVDDQVQAYERQNLLFEIKEKTEAKSNTTLKDMKFDRKDLTKRNRKLLYASNTVQLKISRKFTDTQLLLLTDCVVFLQESGGKYSFPSGQPAVLPLQNLLLREVANDERGLFLISPGSQAMYEMKTQSSDECKTLTQKMRMAVSNCPEDEGIPSEDEEERRQQEQQLDRARGLIAQLEQRDRKINDLLRQKMDVFRDLAESVDRGNPITRNSYSYPTFTSYDEDGKNPIPLAAPILQKALDQVTKLSNAICGSGGLSRHPSSVGEHDTGSRGAAALPKRSDTFGGFDNGKDPPSPRSKFMNTSQSDSKLKDLDHDQLQPASSESSKRDSGLVDYDITVRRTDSQNSINKAWPAVNNGSSRNSSPTASTAPDVEFPLVPPTTDQVSALAQLTNLFQSFLSVATQQDTHIERLHLQLSQDRTFGKKNRSGTIQEAEMKRNQIKQQEQMDDLRRQQQQLKAERDQFNKTNERFQRSIDRDRVELEEAKQKLRRDENEMQQRQAEVARLKEEHQKELTRLRDLQRKYDHLHGSSSTSSLASASNKNNSNNLDAVDAVRGAADAGKGALSGSKSFSSLQGPVTSSSKAPPSPTWSNPADYPKTFPGMKRDSTVPGQATAGHQSLPLHLQYSATNQIAGAMQPPKHQALPFKIANPSKADKHGVHQIIPNKLSKLASGGQSAFGSSHTSSKKPHIV